jgi:hypothetical protein
MSNTQAINSAWEQKVRTILMGEEFEKLGLAIGNEQLINVIKQNPNFAQNQQFLNAAGQFDENKFKEYIKSLKNAPNQVIANHLEAVNHCPTTRNQLKSEASKIGFTEKIFIPNDGESRTY